MADLVATATVRDAQYRAGLARMERDGKRAMGTVAGAGDRAGASTLRLASAVRVAKIGLIAAAAASGTMAGLTARYARENTTAAASLRDVRAAADQLGLSLARDLFLGATSGAMGLASALTAVRRGYEAVTEAVNRAVGDGALGDARREARVAEAMDRERRDASTADRMIGEAGVRQASAEGRDLDAFDAQQQLRRRALMDSLNASTLPGNTRQTIIAAADAADASERAALEARINEQRRQKESADYIREHGRTGERTLEGGAAHLFRQVFGPGARSEDREEQRRHEAELEQLRRANGYLDRISRGHAATYA